MGLFSGIQNKKLNSSRVNDSVGRYWQRLEAVEQLESQSKKPYLKVKKLIVNTFEGDHPVGTEPSHALFPDRYGYFLLDVKKLIRAALDLTTEQANEMSESDVESILEDKLLDGRTLEVLVTTKEGRDGKTYPVINYLRSVKEEEIKDKLDVTLQNRFWPEGL
tara:strand:- start:275 stop:763 length:489 start_codon:yes stop_codon:yes gene_type:complete